LPANASAGKRKFLEHFDGFLLQFGSQRSDLSLTLGLIAIPDLLPTCFDERNCGGQESSAMAISPVQAADKYIGICGQGPSDQPGSGHAWLMAAGIESVSLTRTRCDYLVLPV